MFDPTVQKEVIEHVGDAPVPDPDAGHRRALAPVAHDDVRARRNSASRRARCATRERDRVHARRGESAAHNAQDTLPTALVQSFPGSNGRLVKDGGPLVVCPEHLNRKEHRMNPTQIGRTVLYRSRTGDYTVPAVVTATKDTLNPMG
jgi:hypothetical protein